MGYIGGYNLLPGTSNPAVCSSPHRCYASTVDGIVEKLLQLSNHCDAAKQDKEKVKVS